MREDRFSNTEADAAAYERHRAQDDVDDRPTLAELQRDEGDEDCLHLHQKDTSDPNDPWAEQVWVCTVCEQVCEP
jgi:hypothetical protein